MQKEHLTRFNTHLALFKLRKQGITRNFLNLYREATKTETKLHRWAHSKDVHSHHSYTTLKVLATAIRQEKERKKNTAWERSKTIPICRQHDLST